MYRQAVAERLVMITGKSIGELMRNVDVEKFIEAVEHNHEFDFEICGIKFTHRKWRDGTGYTTPGTLRFKNFWNDP